MSVSSNGIPGGLRCSGWMALEHGGGAFEVADAAGLLVLAEANGIVTVRFI